MMELAESIVDGESQITIKPALKKNLATFVGIVRKLRRAALKGTSVADLIRLTIEKTNYEEYLRPQPDFDQRWENVQELVSIHSLYKLTIRSTTLSLSRRARKLAQMLARGSSQIPWISSPLAKSKPLRRSWKQVRRVRSPPCIPCSKTTSHGQLASHRQSRLRTASLSFLTATTRIWTTVRSRRRTPWRTANSKLPSDRAKLTIDSLPCGTSFKRRCCPPMPKWRRTRRTNQ